MLVINTDFHGQSRNSGDLKNTLARIAQAGFSHIHWCHEFHSSYVYSVYEMLQIKEWCGELGLKVKGVHATIGEGASDLKRYTSLNEYNRLAGVDLIKNRVDMAYILEAGFIVLHFNGPWERENDECIPTLVQPALKSFDELEPYCKTRHIKLCLENGGGTSAQCCPVYDFLYNRYAADYMGFCFDTGHANNHGLDDLLAFPERYKDRLFMTHINDNHGGGGEDEHRLPFDGTFDWEGFAPVLARSAFQFPVVMEPDCRTYKDVDEAAWLKKALDTGNRFTAMVEKYR